VKVLRRIGLTLLVLLALLAGGVALAALRLDADEMRAAAGAHLSRVLGRPLALGPARLSLFPPALAIRDVRVGLTREDRLDVDELRFAVSPVPLLLGRVVVRSIDVERPRFVRGPSDGAPEWKADDAARLSVAITRATLRDGVLRLGGQDVEGVRATLELGAGPRAAGFSAELPGLARITGGKLELPEGEDPFPWRLSGGLAGVDLETLSWTKSLPDLWGSARGRFALSGRGATPNAGELELETEDLNANGALVHVTGRARVRLDLTGALALDLGATTLRIADVAEKPPGAPLRVTGRLAEPLDAFRVTDLEIESDAFQASGALDAEAKTLELASGALDFGVLAAWKPASWLPRAGAVDLGKTRIQGDPLVLDATGIARNVAVPVAGVTLVVGGPVSARGTVLSGDNLSVALAGEQISATGSWDWSARRLELALAAKGPRIGPVAQAVWGHKDVSGRLYGRLAVSGPPDPLQLTGAGEFELLDGELPNVSIARTAGLIKTEEEPPGLDQFDRLSGRFEIAGDRIKVSELSLVQKYATASVNGEIELPDGYVNMTGGTLLSFPDQPGPSLHPIMRMAGPWYALETHISMAKTADEIRVEWGTVDAIRKAEKEQRERKRAK